MPGRTLFVVSARLDRSAAEAVAAGRWPRKDFFELARALDADVIDYAAIESSHPWRAVARVAGMPVAQACVAALRADRYTRILSDGEHIGIPLGALLALRRPRPAHVTLAHLLTSRTKMLALRRLRPLLRIDRVLFHAVRQRDAAVGLLPAHSRSVLVPYQIDPLFWSPRDTPAEDLIATAGLEFRDYPTLIAAVRGLPVQVVIAAGSRWSRHRDGLGDTDLPPNVSVTTLDYPALRDAYARSRFVVVPLHDAENQAGVTTLLEAMAMGKAVIVTATRGQRDVVRGRRCTASGVTDEMIGGPAPFGVDSATAGAETGLYVPPGDVTALRQAIRYLLEHPDEAAAMGAAGRRLVARYMDLDSFVRRVAAELDGAGAGRDGAAEGIATSRPASAGD